MIQGIAMAALSGIIRHGEAGQDGISRSILPPEEEQERPRRDTGVILPNRAFWLHRTSCARVQVAAG
jgi:hypothetical protein